MTLLALCVACSQSEVVEQAGSNQRLLFSGSASNIVRTVGYNNTDLPSQISVYGFHTKDGQTLKYFDDIAYLMQDRNTYRTNEEHYWTNGVLSFFSFAFEDLNCITADITTTNHALQFSNPNPLVDSSVEQSDLIYAVNTDCTQEKYGITGVPVFFKHALSQIAFNAAVRNPTIQVEIQSVQLKGLYKQATLTLPEATTSASAEQGAVWSDWKTSQDWCGFDGSVTPAQIAFSASGTTLLSSALRMIPQKDDQVTLSVNCKVTAANDAQIGIFEGERTYDIAIDWQPGVRYTYNLIFDKIGEEIFFVIEIEEYEDEPFKIEYTSFDGQIVKPYYPGAFGANITDNKYENGKGVITFDGPVTSIGADAFYNCRNLTSVTIGNSVTKIGYGAFEGCSSLTSVTIGNSVTRIGERAFFGCSSLTSVTIPDSVTSIGYSAFCNCSSLTAFYGKFASEDNRCLIVNGELTSFAPAGLTEYTTPNSVTEIGGSAFSNCSSLTSVTIPDSVTEIGGHAFYNCSRLPSVTIPDSVTEIGYRAFSDCSSLKEVYCKPTTPPTLGGSAFYGNASGRKIYVPIGSGNAYKSADGWKDYKSAIVEYDL